MGQVVGSQTARNTTRAVLFISAQQTDHIEGNLRIIILGQSGTEATPLAFTGFPCEYNKFVYFLFENPPPKPGNPSLLYKLPFRDAWQK